LSKTSLGIKAHALAGKLISSESSNCPESTSPLPRAKLKPKILIMQPAEFIFLWSSMNSNFP